MMERMRRITLRDRNDRNDRSYSLPSKIVLYECPKKNACYIRLCAEAIGLPKEQTDEPTEPPINMQKGPAAFEAWALLLHTYYSAYKKVYLGLQGGVSLPSWPENQPFLLDSYSHYNRFLYRVMKFQEQYHPWFRIDDVNLCNAVQQV